MSCILKATDGKDSVTHKRLIDIYGIDEVGQDKALEQYEFFKTDSFKERIGYDWEDTKERDAYIELGRINHQGELNIKKDAYGNYVYRSDQSKEYIEFEVFKGFTEAEIKELVNYAIIEGLGGIQGIMEMDFESDILKVDISGKLQPSNEFYQILKNDYKFNNLDIEEFKKRINETLRFNQLKLIDNQDRLIADQNNPNEIELNSDEAAEETRNSNDVVKKDSYTQNSKSTASANIKMMLSFIPEFESYEIAADGEANYELKEGEVAPVVFKPMDQVWRKIEDKLSNIFTKNIDGDIDSVLSQMERALYDLGQEDPTIMFIYDRLRGDNMPDSKKVQFAQAFLKQKILFYTTNVEGKPGEVKMTFYNSNTNTSKEFKLRSEWEAEHVPQSGYYQSKTTKQDKIYYSLNNDNVKNDLKILEGVLADLKSLAKKKATDIDPQNKKIIMSVISNLGIPVGKLNDKTFVNVLKKVQKQVEPTRQYNVVRAAGILVSNYLNPALVILNDVNSKSLLNKQGNFVNPLKSNDLTTLFSNAESSYRDDLSENTMMGADNKMVWGYSLPTYVDITVHKIKSSFVYDSTTGKWTNPYIDKLKSLVGNKNSKWLEWLSNKDNAEKFFQQTFLSYQHRDNRGSSSVDNKKIQFIDQLSDQVNKYLNGVKDGEKSMYVTPAPADKSRLISFIGPELSKTRYTVLGNGGVKVNVNSESIEQLAGYFDDEYERISNVWSTVSNIENVDQTDVKLYANYHLVKGAVVDKNGIPLGNGFKSQLFPELSFDYTNRTNTPTKIEELAKEIRDELYASKANRYEPLGISNETRTKIKSYIKQVVESRILENTNKFKENGIIEVDDNGIISNSAIDTDIWNEYVKNAQSIVDSKASNDVKRNQRKAQGYEIAGKLIGDYTINGLISNIEYSKVFAGDVAYYKNAVDYNKRIPATYTDGKYLADLNSVEDMTFKAAVVQSIELEAKDIDTLEKDFIQSLKVNRSYMPENIRAIYTDKRIEELAKSYVKPFTEVNAADAQAWISLDRWKFLKSKLDGWSDRQEEAYQRLKDGTFTANDLKLAAQPLKGVYFNRDEKTGVPTYLKYSQAVLVPGMFEGTSLENLTKAMEANGLDEVITIDGVKSGALNPTKIHNMDGSMRDLEYMKFNTYDLNNQNWKLQQDLPVKGSKNAMDLGSQLQKNIIANIKVDHIYGKLDGKDLTGQDIVELIDNTMSSLVDKAFDRVKNHLGTDENGKILHPEKFYKELEKQLVDKNMPTFIVNMIRKGYSLDAMPQVRYKAQNIVSSMVNNNISKTITPGGSFIQVSSVGVTSKDVINTDPKTGIYMLKDVNELSRPKIDIDKVSSGQVFLPHSIIAKYIPNYRELTRKQFFEKVDKELINIIGYRIPNQKMSSIQPLEIVGILPPSMGDSIMMYTEITTQTGSDFDIDKTYVMMPEYFYDRNNDKLTYIRSKGNVKEEGEYKQSVKQLRNQLFELYNMILKDVSTYSDMMSSIDGAALKNGINELHGTEDSQLSSLQLMDPLYQLGIKFDNITGKSGVGLTANQMVDHALSQAYNMLSSKNSLPIGNLISNTDDEFNTDIQQDFSQIYDTDGGVITDSISMFLNAFVDIAKDPYITKGNFNSETSNAVFYMLRAGVPLDFVIKFIGQPSLKRAVQLKQQSDSLILDDMSISLKQAVNDTINEYKALLTKIPDSASKNKQIGEAKDIFGSLTTLEKNRKELVKQIQSPKENAYSLTAQIAILNHMHDIIEMSEPLSELVLASKADVNGGGPDIASHKVNASRYNKVMDNKEFTNLEERFAPNTMLGSKTQRTINYLNKLDQQLFISSLPAYDIMYSFISGVSTAEPYLLNKDKVSSIEKQIYSNVMMDVLNDTEDFRLKDVDVQTMVKSEGNNKSIADRVSRLKEQDDLKDNALIQNLEIKQVGLMRFVSLDNFMGKPSSSLDELSRAWQELLDSEKYNTFGKDLVKYAFLTSGFSKNRNSIYEIIPDSVSDTINRAINRVKQEYDQDTIVPIETINNFFLSVHNVEHTPKMTKNTTKDIDLIGSSKEIKSILQNDDLNDLKLNHNDVIMIPYNLSVDDNQAEMNYVRMLGKPVLVRITYTDPEFGPSQPIFTYYKNQGEVTIGTENDELRYIVLSKSHKLGYNDNGQKIFETNKGKSDLNSNNPKNYDNILKFVEMLPDLVDDLDNSYVNMSHYAKRAQIRESEKALDTLTRRKIMEEKC